MKKKALIIGLATLILSGCIVRFIYNHLDWIIPWYVGRMITLDQSQETDLGKKLAAQLKWHRVSQLTLYEQSLRELSAAVQTNLTRKHLDRFHLTMRRYWQDLVRHVAPDLARILSTATDEQVAELSQSLLERNQTFREKYIDPPEAELREIKVDRMTRFLEFFIGDLTEEQERIVEQWSRDLKNIAPVRFEYIQQRQDRFRRILKRRSELPWFEKELTELLCFKRETWPEPFRQLAEHNRELTKKVFLQIHQCMTADQKEAFAKTALSLADEFQELSMES